MSDPKCPWCGENMGLWWTRSGNRVYSGTYECKNPECRANGPMVTEYGRKETEKAALAAVLRFAPQKPLTLHELLSLDGTDIDGIKPVWCEDATGDENSGWLLFDCKQKRIFNPYKNEWHAFGSESEKAVGKPGCWRPWLRKPTDEERIAAPWEV